MTKKEVLKEAKQLIFKEQESHQAAFDNLKNGKSKLHNSELAEYLSKIPSVSKFKSVSNWRYIFITLLIVLIILRLLFFYVLMEEGALPALSIALIISLLIPAMGIVAALSHRVNLYRIVGIFIGLGLLRAIPQMIGAFDPWDLIGIVPAAIVVTLAFYIPEKMKTPFKKEFVAATVNGTKKGYYKFTFDEVAIAGEVDLLDS